MWVKTTRKHLQFISLYAYVLRSYGIVMWEVCAFGDHPYPKMTDENVIELLKTAKSCNMENPAPPSDPAHSL